MNVILLMDNDEKDAKPEAFELKYNKKSIKVIGISVAEKEEWVQAIKQQITAFEKDSDIGPLAAKKSQCNNLFITHFNNIFNN